MKFTHKLFMLALAGVCFAQIDAIEILSNSIRTVRGLKGGPNLILTAKSIAEVKMVVASLSSADQTNGSVLSDMYKRISELNEQIAEKTEALKKADITADAKAKLEKEIAELNGVYPMYKKVYNNVVSRKGAYGVAGYAGYRGVQAGLNKYADVINPAVTAGVEMAKGAYGKFANAPVVNRVWSKTGAIVAGSVAGAGLLGYGAYKAYQNWESIKQTGSKIKNWVVNNPWKTAGLAFGVPASGVIGYFYGKTLANKALSLGSTALGYFDAGVDSVVGFPKTAYNKVASLVTKPAEVPSLVTKTSEVAKEAANTLVEETKLV